MPGRRSASNSVDELAGYENVNNTLCAGEIVVSGKSFEVVLDTGSHDFWLANSSGLANYTNTSVSATLDYFPDTGVVWSVSGFALIADTQFANFTVQNQAFLADVTNASAFLSGINGNGGLLGLAPPTASGAISSALQKANVTFSHGSSVLENIFAQNPDVEPQFTMLMSRNDGEHTTSGGTFTLGNPLSKYANITDQPILPIMNTTTGRQHWTVMIDSIILNNGTLKVNLPAVLDSGVFSAAVTQEMYSGIYSALPPSLGSPKIMPIVPCTAMIEVAFVIGRRISSESA